VVAFAGDSVVTLRFCLGASFALVVGCNALLDNEEGTLIDSTGGRTPARGGASSGGGGGLAGALASEGGTESTNEGGTSNGPPATGGETEQSPQAGTAGSDPTTGGTSNPDPGESGGAGGASEGSGGSAGSAGEAEAGASGCVSNECTPMTVEMVEVSCGPCGLGHQLAPRACRSDCTWSEPAAATGACDTSGIACDPSAAPAMRTAPCANGGWRNQKQSCTSDCKLGEWTDTEACQSPPNPCTGCACVSYCDHPERHVTTCLWVACSQSEAWAECEADIAAISCTRRPPVELIDWRPI
jgi:hypothetical protein